jgi:hypothetical protein
MSGCINAKKDYKTNNGGGGGGVSDSNVRIIAISMFCKVSGVILYLGTSSPVHHLIAGKVHMMIVAIIMLYCQLKKKKDDIFLAQFLLYTTFAKNVFSS